MDKPPTLESILTALQLLEEDNKAIRQENTSLRETLVHNQKHHAEPKVSLPEKFDGTRSKFRGFINQVRLVIKMQPTRYPNEVVQVGFLASLLQGPALAWFAPLLEQDSNLLYNFQDFLIEFEATFGDTEKVRTAANRIRTLRQGNRSASTYASEFRQIACDLDWGENALIEHFRIGLHEDVKDLLLTMDDPFSFNDAVQKAVRCDNRLFERRQESRQNRRFSTVPRHSFATVPPSPIVSPMASPRTTPTVPMEVDAMRFGPLSSSEKQRRRENNLCLLRCSRPHCTILY
jgi:hypothetical protein